VNEPTNIPGPSDTDLPFSTTPIDANSHIDASTQHVILVRRNESLTDIRKRLEAMLPDVREEDIVLIIFPKRWEQKVAQRSRQEFFELLSPLTQRAVIAGHDRVILLSAKECGLGAITSRTALKDRLNSHPERTKALRHYSSDEWQEWMVRGLQRLRIVSVHRVSVILFLIASVSLFFMVLFVALPSARIRVWPRVNLVSHTANVILATSGALVPIQGTRELALLSGSGGQTVLIPLRSHRRQVLPLIPIRSDIHRYMTFDEISKKFLGENAEVMMSFVNETDEPYSFRGGTRLANQAGMVFRTLEPASIPAESIAGPGTVAVPARAHPTDLYQQIIGERGNVPAGLKWEILGLPPKERQLVYARNVDAATGGKTAYGTELEEKDLTLARKQLEQELLSAAKVRIEEEVELLASQEGGQYVVLQYDVLTKKIFSGLVLPYDLVGQSVSSLPVEGSLTYIVLAYNKNALLDLLLPGLREHVDDGQELIPETAVIDGISVHVIEYDDSLRWVKITAELTGKERAVLSPVSPTGRLFGERVRDAIQGKTVSEAERIIQNFPEVDRVNITMWPPWRRALPSLSSNIVLLSQE
jgi:hypothetical protein